VTRKAEDRASTPWEKIMSAFLSLLAAALIASAGTDFTDAAPAMPASSRTADTAPGLVTPFESWAGLDLELVRLPGEKGPADPSAGSA
jgi:hypothetical protein